MFNLQTGGVLIDGKNYRWYFIEKEGMWQVQDVLNNKLFKVRDSYHTNSKNRQAYLTEKIKEYLANPEGKATYIIIYNEDYLNSNETY